MKTEQKPNIDFAVLTEGTIDLFYTWLERNVLEIEARTLKKKGSDKKQVFFNDLKTAIVKARCYDLERLKRSQGGRKSSQNMTAEQRSERARRAGSTKKRKPDLSI